MHWTMDRAPPLPHPLSLCLSFATAFMMCGCLVNPVPIMRMWVLRIPNGHFPFRPLCPQASSLYTHTPLTHTHIQTVALCGQRTRLSTKYWLQASFEATFILLLCSLFCSPFSVSHCSPCCRLSFVVVCMLDKNQTDPELTYVSAASWCRSPRALFPYSLFPLPPALFARLS